MQGDSHECEHDACNCIIDSTDAFCSPYCEGRSDTGEGAPCGCGHAGCENPVGEHAAPMSAA